MRKDERDLLDVLKFELEFLDKGGYGRSPREPWRPIFIFEDSPTCMNYDCKQDPAPCSDCVLMQLVPPELRFGKIPCRNIALNAEGETLDSMYRYDDQHEIEETIRKWIVATIAPLEEERKALQRTGHGHSEEAPVCQAVKERPLCQNFHPKCANPACPTAFRWLAGGKFFRFRPDEIPVSVCKTPEGSPVGLHGVHHYWLCERCSHIFTLVYDEQLGVVLKLFRLELPLADARKELLPMEPLDRR